MTCGKCGKELEDCPCPDKRERIHKIIDLGIITYRKCTICQEHYALCECTDPDRLWTTNAGDSILYGTEWDPRRPTE